MGALEARQSSPQGLVASQVSLSRPYPYAFFGFDLGPDSFFGVFSVGRRDGDQSVEKVIFEGENIVGRISYPTIAHIIFDKVGVCGLLSRPASECLHVMNTHCEEGTKMGGKRFEREKIRDRGRKTRENRDIVHCSTHVNRCANTC